MTEAAVVTGAAGWIGSHLVRTLVDVGASVVAVDRHLPQVSRPATPLVVDLAEPGALDALLRPDHVIFHLAGNSSPARAAVEPAADMRATFLAFFNVLESARRAGCRVVFVSSAAVFASASDPLSEAAPVRPSSPYGAAKAAGEAYARAYTAAYGLDVRIARLFNVYGPGMRQFAVHDILRRLLARPERLTLLGTGTETRDYLYIDDAVRALMLIAARGDVGEDYNVGSGIGTRIADLASRCAALLGLADTVIGATGQSWPGDVEHRTADVTKLRAIGFAPTVGLEAGLRRTIEWMASVATAGPTRAG